MAEARVAPPSAEAVRESCHPGHEGHAPVPGPACGACGQERQGAPGQSVQEAGAAQGEASQAAEGVRTAEAGDAGTVSKRTIA